MGFPHSHTTAALLVPRLYSGTTNGLSSPPRPFNGGYCVMSCQVCRDGGQRMGPNCSDELLASTGQADVR